jgi:hypothetical protein
MSGRGTDVQDYGDQLAHAGFINIAIEPTHEFGDGIHSAIIRAVKA